MAGPLGCILTSCIKNRIKFITVRKKRRETKNIKNLHLRQYGNGLSGKKNKPKIDQDGESCYATVIPIGKA